MDDLFAETRIKNVQVEIIYTNKLADISSANLVFVSGSETRQIREIVAVLHEKPILIISDTDGFCAFGTHINMYEEGNYIRFEINPVALDKSGLKVTSLLLASAKIVNTND